MKKKKQSLLLLVSILVVLAAAFYLFFYLSAKNRRVAVRAGQCNFQTELAQTPKQWYKGLSNHSPLASNQGMLFLFPDSSDRVFVMRDMLFPLDIVFIKDHRIINLYHNLAPEGANPKTTYHSGGPADTVLEIPAGRSRDCLLGVGSQVNW